MLKSPQRIIICSLLFYFSATAVVFEASAIDVSIGKNGQLKVLDNASEKVKEVLDLDINLEAETTQQSDQSEKTEQPEKKAKEAKLQIPANLKAQKSKPERSESEIKARDVSPLEQIKEIQQEKIEKIRDKRRHRVSENVEIFYDDDKGADGCLVLKSRESSAKIACELEFSIDVDTNSLFISLPNGEQIEINHLPDQAINTLLSSGTIVNRDEAENLELTVESGNKLVYQIDTVRNYKLLGIFRRPIPKRIALDDSTGEIIISTIESGKLMDKLLDALSL